MLSPSDKDAHIIIVTHSYPRFKGDWRSNFIESLAIGYIKNGVKVTVFVPFTIGWNRESQTVDGIDIVTYKYMPFNSWHVFGYGKSMKGDLKMNLLHILLVPFLIFFGGLKLSAKLKKEKISFLHAHWAIPNTLIAIFARFLSKSKVKVFTSFPGSDVTVISKLGFLGEILANIINKSDYLSCNSSDLKEDLINSGMSGEKIDYVIYGVNNFIFKFSQFSRNTIRKKFNISDKNILLLMVGRFIPKKGFVTGIKAMQSIVESFPNVRMLIIGSGVEECKYKSLIKDFFLEDFITLAGEIPLDELNKYYSACDIFLMPSERFPSDGLNVVVVEAMSCSRPIIASNVGGNDLVVFDNENGFLHQAGDEKDIFIKLKPLLNNSNLRLSMGNKSRALVDERFNWNSIAKHYIGKCLALSN
jgi:glycosyltransferase involved in cell wall biosynthesis